MISPPFISKAAFEFLMFTAKLPLKAVAITLPPFIMAFPLPPI